MQFGICAPPEQSAELKALGADFIEGGVQPLTQPLSETWKPAASVLPILAANVLLPGTHRVTGPDVDPAKLKAYVERVVPRAKQLGIRRIVFGSGGARKIPDGFSREKAFAQLVDFAKLLAVTAEPHGLIFVAEPLNRTETNVLNSVGESAKLVAAVNHPNFRLLVDSYHFWLENDSLDDLIQLMPMIEHVHVADKDGRVYPGESGTSDYKSFFAVLKSAGYKGLISIEALSNNPLEVAARSLKFLRDQWATA